MIQTYFNNKIMCMPVQNLIARSNTFSAWIKTNLSITSNSIANPIDGDLTASTLIENSSNALHAIQPSAVIGSVINQIYTVSVYAKAGSRNFLAIETNQAALGWFNLGTGVLGSLNDSTQTTLARYMISLGSGWYRCIWTFRVTGNATASLLTFLIPTNVNSGTSYLGNGSDSIYFYQVQVNTGNAITPYVETGATFINPAVAPRLLPVGQVAPGIVL